MGFFFVFVFFCFPNVSRGNTANIWISSDPAKAGPTLVVVVVVVAVVVVVVFCFPNVHLGHLCFSFVGKLYLFHSPLVQFLSAFEGFIGN